MWKNGDDGTGEVLTRIVLTLVSLAGLALRAAHAPPKLRRYTLGLARAGELAALSLLIDLPFSRRTAIRWLEPEDDSPDGAMLIAFRLRLLAFAIARMIGSERSASHKRWIVTERSVAHDDCSVHGSLIGSAYFDTS